MGKKISQSRRRGDPVHLVPQLCWALRKEKAAHPMLYFPQINSGKDKIRKVVFLYHLADFSLKFMGFSRLALLWLQCHFNWHLVIKEEETKLPFLRTISSMYFPDSFRMLPGGTNRVLLCPCPSPRAHPLLYRPNTSVLMIFFKTKTNFLCALN